MIPLEEAREFVLSNCRRLEAVEMSSDEALGGVSAAGVIAPESLPPFDNSSMDGYALRAADTEGSPVRLEIVGALMAGGEHDSELRRGQALRIMTGAPIPRGADAVCMVEHTRVEDGQVLIEQALKPGTNVRRVGDDVRAGESVLAEGIELTPGHLGLLAALGVETIGVYRRPKVGVLSTGDELVEGPGRLGPGKIRDANRHSLLALVRRHAQTVDLGIVGDDEGALALLLERAATECDALVTSGGVSVGDRDVVRMVLEELSKGTMRWMQVAIKPAKPFAFGLLGDRNVPVFGLPGNPVSALVSFALFAMPALRLMSGHRRLDAPVVRAVTRGALPRTPDGRLHLLRVTMRVGDDGMLEVHPSEQQGSHQLRAMADANALALVPDGEGIEAGGVLDVLVLEPRDIDGRARATVSWVR